MTLTSGVTLLAFLLCGGLLLLLRFGHRFAKGGELAVVPGMGLGSGLIHRGAERRRRLKDKGSAKMVE